MATCNYTAGFCRLAVAASKTQRARDGALTSWHFYVGRGDPVPNLALICAKERVYAQRLNRRHRRSGHLFGRPLQRAAVRTDAPLCGQASGSSRRAGRPARCRRARRDNSTPSCKTSTLSRRRISPSAETRSTPSGACRTHPLWAILSCILLDRTFRMASRKKIGGSVRPFVSACPV
jgi:hypothetical protein